MRRENKKGTQIASCKTPHETQEKENCVDVAVNNSSKQIPSTDSDCSLSPSSTVLSSVRSHSPYMGSVPPIDSVQPSPPILSYQKSDPPSSRHSHELSAYDRHSMSFVQACETKSPNSESVAHHSVTLEASELTSQLSNQNSQFSDVKRNHDKPQWKDTKWSARSNYRESVNVQSFGSDSAQGSCGRSNDSSPHPPPLLPLSRPSPSLFHRPLSVDASENTKSQEHIEFSMRNIHSKHSNNIRTSKKYTTSPTRQPFDNLTVEVTSNSNNCSSEPSYNPDRTSDTSQVAANSNSCRQDSIRSPK
ncbi:unnamed protein product [Heterobilharzia americana]|nr:unnamed protein product [Heterobilharzia americana]